jgi:mitogen-activated protein kinase kinase kinase
MAMLASKNPIAAPLGSARLIAGTSAPQAAYSPARRAPGVQMASQQSFASPTESEFSEDEGPDSVKNWDEDQVCDYLRSVKCGDYERLFRKNHINGENLLEMDKEVLKEIGIDKVGDRVRLFLSIKKLRTKAYANQKKRSRVSSATHRSRIAADDTNPSMYSRTPLPASTDNMRPRLAHPEHCILETADPLPTKDTRVSTNPPHWRAVWHRGPLRPCLQIIEQDGRARDKGTQRRPAPAPRDTHKMVLTKADLYKVIPGTSPVLMVP